MDILALVKEYWIPVALLGVMLWQNYSDKLKNFSLTNPFGRGSNSLVDKVKLWQDLYNLSDPDTKKLLEALFPNLRIEDKTNG